MLKRSNSLVSPRMAEIVPPPPQPASPEFECLFLFVLFLSVSNHVRKSLGGLRGRSTSLKCVCVWLCVCTRVCVCLCLCTHVCFFWKLQSSGSLNWGMRRHWIKALGSTELVPWLVGYWPALVFNSFFGHHVSFRGLPQKITPNWGI